MSRSLAERLAAHAAGRLRARHPDWAAAMLGELQHLPEGERLRWALGCLGASFAAPGAGAALIYPTALAGGVVAMIALQWSIDEGVATVVLLGGIGLLLGLLRPRRVLLSGLLVGVTVAGVLAFETLTGLRPAYEDRLHSLPQDLAYTLLAAPALAAAAAGRLAAARLAIRSRP